MMKDYNPDIPCECGHEAKYHRKESKDGIFLTFNLFDCSKCDCKKFISIPIKIEKDTIKLSSEEMEIGKNYSIKYKGKNYIFNRHKEGIIDMYEVDG